jgi:methylenetetrahydrofolate reductase (NADH)
MDLKTRFEMGAFAVLAEMDPPKGADLSEMKTNARRIKGAVDVFLVAKIIE